MKLDEKKKAVRKTRNKIKKLFAASLEKDQLEAMSDLIDNIAFLAFALSELRQEILETGYTEHYDNGGHQSGTKDSAAVRTYNNMAKSYNTLVKTALSMIPTQERKETKDRLADFIAN